MPSERFISHAYHNLCLHFGHFYLNFTHFNKWLASLKKINSHDICLNLFLQLQEKAIAVTVMEGVINMFRCPLAVLLTFKTHQKIEKHQKQLSKEFRQQLEIQDALRKRMELQAMKGHDNDVTHFNNVIPF